MLISFAFFSLHIGTLCVYKLFTDLYATKYGALFCSTSTHWLVYVSLHLCQAVGDPSSQGKEWGSPLPHCRSLPGGRLPKPPGSWSDRLWKCQAKVSQKAANCCRLIACMRLCACSSYNRKLWESYRQIEYSQCMDRGLASTGSPKHEGIVLLPACSGKLVLVQPKAEPPEDYLVMIQSTTKVIFVYM